MTASILPCCARFAERLLRGLCIALVAMMALNARGDEGAIRFAEIVPGDGGYVLNADVDLELNSRLADVVARGVSLYFTAELRIERPRWYWLNEAVVDRTLDYRLHYNAITRSYRLSIGSFQQSFDSLDAAVRTMLRIRNWQIAATDELKPGVSHQVALRFRLDTTQLPKPFQVTAIGSRDWDLGTEWLRWTFLPGAPGSR